MPDVIIPGAQATIYAISAARFNSLEALGLLAQQGIACNVVHILWLKPFELTPRMVEPLKESGRGLVIDAAYEIAGASESIAYKLMLATGRPVKAVGQCDRTGGVASPLENGTPTPERIANAVQQLVKESTGAASWSISL
jgi:pyruvate/2-oxoglutarate/acetoin dehydrogenase E1 component